MHLLRYVLKIDTGRQILLMIMVVTAVLLSYANVGIEGRIIDEAIGIGIKTGKSDILIRYIVFYFIFLFLSQILDYYAGILFTYISQKTLIQLRTQLYHHVLRLDMGFFHKTSVGEIISRIIPEVQQLGNFLSQILLIPINAGVTIIMGLGLVAGIDWRLGLLSLGIFSLVFFFMPSLRKRLTSLTKKWSRNLRDISRQTEDSVSHYMEIQSNNTFQYEEEKFEKSLRNALKINMDIVKVYGKTTFISHFFSGLATLAVYGVGGWMVIQSAGNPGGGLTLGSLFIMIRALGNIISPINALIDFSQKYQEALVKFDMISDYLNIPPEMTDGDKTRDIEELKGDISVRNASFGFESDRKIIKNINITIKQGEHVALVGPAGCGKSTLSLLLNRMIRLSAGDIKIQEEPLYNISLRSIRKNIGYVSQAKTNNPVLFGGTLVDNILYSLMTGRTCTPEIAVPCLDLESAGIKSAQQLQEEVLEIIKDTGLYEDVFNFGLRSVTMLEALKHQETVFRIRDPQAIRTEILKGRKKFQEKVAGKYEGLVEFFDENRFMDYCSIIENIIFTSAEPFLTDKKMWEEMSKDLEPACQKAGIYRQIYQIGSSTILEISQIFKRIKSENSPLFRKLGMNRDELLYISELGEKLKLKQMTGGEKELTPPEINKIFRLGFEYSIPRGVDVYIDEAFKEKVLSARRIFKENLSPQLKEKIVFYDKNNYIDGATIRDNLIMGKINTLEHRAEEKIAQVIREVVHEVQLEDEIITLGLLMDIGERGSRLSGGQAQKTAICRALIKNPRILILDEATSALDNASQQKINEMINKRFRDKTVITIAHRLDTIKNYDNIVVLKAGEIVETGTFDQLTEQRGVFYQLWQTLFNL